MAVDNDIVRRGYLNVVRNPKDGMFGSLTSSVTSRRYWVVLRKETSRVGRSRLQLYRSEDQVFHGDPHREIGLEEVRSLQQLDQKKSFVLQTPTTALLFMCSSRADLQDWVADVRRFRTNRLPSISASDSTGQDVYEAVPDDETFHVRLRKSSSVRFHGSCLLEILRDFDRNLFHVALFTDEEPPRLIVKWQIDHIRQYGSNQVAFKFQSGSKSPTGVDWFILDTDTAIAPRIHRSVDYWAQHIVEQVKNMQQGGARNGSMTRPPRTDSCAASSPPLPNRSSHGHQEGAYAGLVAVTKEPPTVYEHLDNPQNGTLPAAPHPTHGSHYQPLHPSTLDSTIYDNETTYQDLNHQTRGSLSPTVQSGSHAVYMGLDPTTQNRPTAESSYMGLKEARS